MLIVISIITIVGGIGLFFGFDALRGYSFHSDRDILISALHICRSTVPADCTTGKPHGVYIDTTNHKYIIFQGTNYANHLTTNDKDYDASLDASASTEYEAGSLNEVVFTQLSGDVSLPGFIKIKNTDAHTSQIDINSEGQILWSN
jgi:Tfp pilus assembly protein FimT